MLAIIPFQNIFKNPLKNFNFRQKYMLFHSSWLDTLVIYKRGIRGNLYSDSIQMIINVFQYFNHFWSFFRQLYGYLSQN